MPLSQSIPERRPLAALALGLALILALLVPPASRAEAPITDVYAGPITASSTCSPTGAGAVPSTQAGSRSDFCVAFGLNSPAPAGDDLDRMVVDTPLGFVGDPTGRPICTAEEFGAETQARATCPAGSQVGDARVNLRFQRLANGGALTINAPGQAYVVTPAANEVARIGS